MPRRSQQIDRALLASARALFPATGCARLSVRAVAEHAGVQPAMLHYHFGTKDGFLRTLLQQLYEEMFAALAGSVQPGLEARAQLVAALTTLARFARAQRPALTRLWIDALAGEPVAVEFFARNSPRHIGLLLELLQRAQDAGALRPMAPLQALAFLLGAVVLPMLFVAGLVQARAVPPTPTARFDAEVMSDAALDERIERALAVLAAPATPARATARRASRAGKGVAA